MNQKQLWDDLAKKNSRYYINTDKGKGITEEDFRESGRRDVETHILNDLNIVTEGKILEIGCGIGRMTEFMSSLFDVVYAVDISGEMIRQGKERLIELCNIKFIETDGETIQLPTNSIDVAFSYLVFQHYKTHAMVESNFKEVRRVLMPGGLFKVLLRTDEPEVEGFWWAGVSYNEKTIKELCSKVKLKVIELEYVGSHGVWLWARK